MKSENIVISIIVLIYNMQEYLPGCIDSLCQQTYKYLEILLIDDGSTDLYSRICDEYSSKDDRVKFFHKENSGNADVLNYGLSLEKGDYISFVDGDDYIETRETFFRFSQVVQHSKVDIILGNYSKYLNGRLIKAKEHGFVGQTDTESESFRN